MSLLNANAAMSGTIAIGATSTTDKTVYWRWKFSDGVDVADTALGVASTPSQVTVTAGVVFTQID